MSILLKIKELFSFLHAIWEKRQTLFVLVARGVKTQYAGSYLGWIWLYVQPIFFILILYFVFTMGLRTGSTSQKIPFVVYLTSGILPWFYFSACLQNSPSIIQKYAYLVRKTDFRLSILPIVNLIENALTHFVIFLIVIIIAWVNDFPPSWHLLQFFYYYFAMFVFLLGVSWFNASTNLFVKDISNIVNISVQFGFWLTPIVWDVDLIPSRYIWLIKMNPVYYLVEGYRNCLIYKKGLWEDPALIIYFWSITLSMCFVGALVFKKLRPHFAEVI